MSVVEAARTPVRGRSKEAARLFRDLMDAPLEPRRRFMKTLQPADWVQVLAIAQREGGTPYALWADDPVGFVTDVLQENTWSKPREILSALPHNRYIAVPSCFSSGKTWSSARALLWFAMVHPPGRAKVITMAPTWQQVARLLWQEVRYAHSRAGLPGKADMVQMRVPGPSGNDEIVAYGISGAAGNEARVQGIHCFDAETELLTDEGWKPFPEVRGDERVLTLNGDVAEWGPITKVWRHPFKGEMNLHDGARVNFCITDNHRLLVRGTSKKYGRWSKITAEQAEEIKQLKREGKATSRELAQKYGVSSSLINMIARGDRDHSFGEGPRWKLAEYSDLPEKFVVRRTNTWAGESPEKVVLEIPGRLYRKAERYEFDFGDWCELLGWYVAEGSTDMSTGVRGTGCIRVSISQKPGPKYEQIAELLTRMGVQPRRRSHDLNFGSDAIGEWLREHCGVGSHNKRVPRIVKEARPEHMERFLAAYNAGDGHNHNDAGGRRYVTSSVQLRDDLHEMLCKLGRGRKYMAAHAKGSETAAPGPDGTMRAFVRKQDVWHIHDPGDPTDSDVLKENVQRVPYDGMVYCVSTPHETIMVRRRGCSMWSGNSPNLLLIVDEAGGIGHAIGNNLRGMTSTDGSHMLAIGNPPSDEEGSWFEGLCNNRGDGEVLVIPISAHDTPALSGEKAPACRSCSGELKHPVTKHLVTRDFVNETVREHGEDSNYVQAKVYARFPKGGPNRVLPSVWVDNAAAAEELPDAPEVFTLNQLGLPEETAAWRVRENDWIRLGVDVAAGGGDEFVIARAVGDLLTVEHTSAGPSNANSNDVAGVVLQHIRRAEALRRAIGTKARVRVKIDVIGVGWGVYSTLHDWSPEGKGEPLHDAEIVPVQAAESTDRDPDGATLMPQRKRDEMWLAMRSLLQPNAEHPAGRVRLRLDTRTLAQLRSPIMSSAPSGHTVIESKKKMKERGLTSPDRAEACLMAVYEPQVKQVRKAARLLV